MPPGVSPGPPNYPVPPKGIPGDGYPGAGGGIGGGSGRLYPDMDPYDDEQGFLEEDLGYDPGMPPTPIGGGGMTGPDVGMPGAPLPTPGMPRPIQPGRGGGTPML